ncbi:hypothetical protein Avbf_05385 [Armadillidium vulgare]|nr:hypothetical protein Avbf_05385 [Armadillidium vulgare]
MLICLESLEARGYMFRICFGYMFTHMFRNRAAEDPKMKKLFTMMQGWNFGLTTSLEMRQLSEGLLDEVAGNFGICWSFSEENNGDGGKKSNFVGSIDTGAEKKTANYISDLAIKQMRQFEVKYKCKGWLREKEGKKPQMPNDTCWNSQCTCVDTFIQNFPLYIEIRNKHYAEIGNNIAAIIDNVAIHREVMNLQNQLNIVDSALDRLQSDSCLLGD